MFGLSVLAPEGSALLTLCDGICTVMRKPSTLFRGGLQSLEFKTSELVDTMNIFLYCQPHIFFRTTLNGGFTYTYLYIHIHKCICTYGEIVIHTYIKMVFKNIFISGERIDYSLCLLKKVQ